MSARMRPTSQATKQSGSNQGQSTPKIEKEQVEARVSRNIFAHVQNQINPSAHWIGENLTPLARLARAALTSHPWIQALSMRRVPRKYSTYIQQQASRITNRGSTMGLVSLEWLLSFEVGWMSPFVEAVEWWRHHFYIAPPRFRNWQQQSCWVRFEVLGSDHLVPSLSSCMILCRCIY